MTTTALIVVLVLFSLPGMWLGAEMQRAHRIARARDPKPPRRSWLCAHGIHAWPYPAYDAAVCRRCGKPYLEP